MVERLPDVPDAEPHATLLVHKVYDVIVQVEAAERQERVRGSPPPYFVVLGARGGYGAKEEGKVSVLEHVFHRRQVVDERLQDVHQQAFELVARVDVCRRRACSRGAGGVGGSLPFWRGRELRHVQEAVEAADEYGRQIGLHHGVYDGLGTFGEDPDDLEDEQARLRVRLSLLAEELEQGEGWLGALGQLGHVPIQKPGYVLRKIAHFTELGLQLFLTEGGAVLYEEREEPVELSLLLRGVCNLVVVKVLLPQRSKPEFLGRCPGGLRCGRGAIPG